MTAAAPSSTVTPAVHAIQRFFLEHGEPISTGQAQSFHRMCVLTWTARLPEQNPNWRIDGPKRRLVVAWLGRGSQIQYEAHILSKDREQRYARLNAWIDAGCPWARY